MKKALLLLLCSFSIFAAVPAKQELSARLAKNDGFSASFEQKVVSPEGDVINEATGTVNISRPSLFRWETKGDDENLIVSDGKTVWYYSPFVEQVTIYDQNKATAHTPFILLTRNKESDWAHYQVTRNGDAFTLTPTDIQSAQGLFHIVIDAKGVVKGFNSIESDGQQNLFAFTDFKIGKPDASLFTFNIPEGVEVDDQRQ